MSLRTTLWNVNCIFTKRMRQLTTAVLNKTRDALAQLSYSVCDEVAEDTRAQYTCTVWWLHRRLCAECNHGGLSKLLTQLYATQAVTATARTVDTVATWPACHCTKLHYRNFVHLFTLIVRQLVCNEYKNKEWTPTSLTYGSPLIWKLPQRLHEKK